MAIEKIKAGDLVMAADENGNRGLKRVVRTFARQTDSIVTVNAGEMAIRCTPEHPFFVEGKGFVYAGDLEQGNILVTEAGGCVMVTSVDADDSVNADNTVTVYNFEVEDWHTYYVGEDGVLVHNKCEVTWPDKPHTNKTEGHWETIQNLALEAADQDDVVAVYVNKGLSNIIDGPPHNNRPDIMIIHSDGRVDMIEVMSKTDRSGNLLNRLKVNADYINTAGGGYAADILQVFDNKGNLKDIAEMLGGK